jgi:hypothetical protein
MKRLGLIAFVMALLVFGTEGVLALLRQRTITVLVTLLDSQSPAATAAAANSSGPATPPAVSTLQTMLPDGTVLAQITWNYHIGPRFPVTNIHAVVLDNQQHPVASDAYQIDCGADTIDCSGSYTLSLDYGILEKTGTHTLWPLGDYTLQITRAYGDLKATEIERRAFRVSAQ